MNHADADYYGVSNGDMMQLKISSSDCSVVFDDVLVRADKAAKLEVHIDTDEGNACHLDAATEVLLQKRRLQLREVNSPVGPVVRLIIPPARLPAWPTPFLTQGSF